MCSGFVRQTAAQFQRRALLEMIADPRKNLDAIGLEDCALERRERVRKILLALTLVVAEHFAKLRRVPDVAGFQIPIEQSVRRARDRPLPALIGFFYPAQAF